MAAAAAAVGAASYHQHHREERRHSVVGRETFSYSSYALRAAIEGSQTSNNESHGPRKITLVCHDEENVVTFFGQELSPYPELKRLYYEAFNDLERLLDLEPTAPTFLERELPAFELLDKDFDIYFEDFLSSQITEGSVIRIDSSRIKTAEEILGEAGEGAGSGAASFSGRGPSVTPGGTDGSGISRAAAPGCSAEEGGDETDPTMIKAEGSSEDDASKVGLPGIPGSLPGDDGTKMLGPNKSKRSRAKSKKSLRNKSRHDEFGGIGLDEQLTEVESSGFRCRTLMLRREVWDLLDNPLSSDLGCAVMLLIVLTIIISALVFVLQTIPSLSNGYKDGSFDKWFIAESITIAIFTVELVARVVSCPWPQREFWRDSFNVIDLVAIVPYYISLGYLIAGASVPVIFRMLRLIRIIRLIKLSKGSVNVFSKTMIASMKLLYMLLFMVFLVTLIFGSLMYYAERGEWNPLLGMHMRSSFYLCPINATSPDDPELSVAMRGISEICEPSQSFPDGTTTYMCQYTFRKRSSCKVIREVGPFISILHSTWFVMQTITTVGFGNDTPISAMGKTLAAAVIMFGILVVSLPITVIGAKFSRTYRSHQRRLAAQSLSSRFKHMSWLKRFTGRLVYS